MGYQQENIVLVMKLLDEAKKMELKFCHQLVPVKTGTRAFVHSDYSYNLLMNCHCWLITSNEPFSARSFHSHHSEDY